MSQKLSELDIGHIDKISSVVGEPAWLREYRKKSLSTYKSLPIETSPLYTKYTDAKALDPDMVSLSAHATSGTPPAFLTRRLSELQDEACIIQVGAKIQRVHIPDDMASKGVIISSIHDAISNRGDLVKSALEASDSSDDRFTALNNAAFNSGVFVYIPDGVQIERPIHLVVCLPEDGISVISRNIISAGRASRASIVQELYSSSPPRDKSTQQAYLELLNTSVADGAHIDGTTLQMFDASSVNFSTRRIDLAHDSRVNWYLGLFGSTLTRYRIDYYLNGQGATANDSEVVFGSADQSFDIQTSVNHQSPHTEARVVEKSILRDKSHSLFKGMIRIKENASKSNSFLSGRSILLDKDAKSDAIPSLEISTNDVKATHSASVAQIDEEQIFYLGSRCLSRAEAERTIVEGFLEPLSRKMSYRVRAWIAYLIESKWENRELGINTDEELAKFVEVEETRYNEDAEMEQHYKYR